MRLTSLLLIVIGLIVLAAWPYMVSMSLVNAAIQMLIAALFASAFNMLAGQGGMLSFGHAAYFGIGTFATIHAMEAFSGTGLLMTPLLPLVGAVMGGVTGLFAGWFSTQRSGVYFSMITLALAELLHSLAPHLKSIFGGEAGISSMRMPALGVDFGSAVHVYYLVLFWAIVGIAVLYFITRTPLGRLCVGLRENQQRLTFMGYRVHRLRLAVFVVSAAFSGLAGGLLAMNNEAANYILFEMSLSAQVVLNSYIGGIGYFFGPAVGAAVMSFFGYVVSDLTRSWLLYQGIVFVLVMMFMPSGLFSIGKWWKHNRQLFSFTRVLSIFCMRVMACLAVAGGIVILVEFAARLLAQDYQMRVANSDTWPAINVFGRDWLPDTINTWLLPTALVLVGIGLLHMINKYYKRLQKEQS